MQIDFSGRYVVVTGGTGALGSEVVRTLLRAGAMCSVTCVDESELGRAGFDKGRVHVATGVNLADEQAVERFYSDVAEIAGQGGLWASIHIAGGFDMSPVVETSLEQLTRQWEMNAVTCFLCCREAVRRMRVGGVGAKGGRIVNVAARPALEPRAGAGMVAYTAAKAAVAAMTQAMAEEVAVDGILINAVVPSIMDTPANRRAMPKANHDAWPRLAEVAATIAFLASPQNLVTRGGLVPVYGRS